MINRRSVPALHRACLHHRWQPRHDSGWDFTSGTLENGHDSRYRPLWLNAEDINGNPFRAMTYIANGKEVDGRPSLRYLTLLRDGARAHGLPDHYIRFLDNVEEAP